MEQWLRTGTFVVGLGIGLALAGSSACGTCDDEPEELIEPAPRYGFASVPNEGWVLESGRVEVLEDRLVITYETDYGEQFEVVYLAVDPD